MNGLSVAHVTRLNKILFYTVKLNSSLRLIICSAKVSSFTVFNCIYEKLCITVGKFLFFLQLFVRTL